MKFKYCSRHDIIVMLAYSLIHAGLTESSLLSTGSFSWKQLVLPGFDTIMGVS